MGNLRYYDVADGEYKETSTEQRFPVDTELPAARVAADNLALPTAPDVLATLLAYDGTDLDLLRTANNAQTGRGLAVSLQDGDGTSVVDVSSIGAADGNSASLLAVLAGTYPQFFNGSTWDRQRNNVEGTLLASAARTASVNSADLTNYNARGIVIWLNITVVPGTDTVSLKIVAKDPVSGNYASLLTGAAYSTTGLRTYVVYPGAGSAAIADITGASPFPLPRTTRIEMVHSAASSFTYSVGYALIN